MYIQSIKRRDEEKKPTGMDPNWMSILQKKNNL